MTQRLFFDDPYQTSFEAAVIDRFVEGDFTALVLDKTIFYPTSGGQPHDLGMLNGVQVLDVYDRESDGAIIHVVAEEIPSDVVVGSIDWDRRFDHMQQHSGQHILSQAFIQVADAPTLSFHLGEQSSTIDLKNDKVQPEHLKEAERIANQVVWSNRTIRQRFVDLKELRQLDIRKVPDLDTTSFRLIEISDFDRCACGGTHVFHTGAIGLIKIIGTERRGKELRIEFLCGKRALRDYDAKNMILKSLSTKLTTGHTDIEQTFNKLQEDNKHLRKELRAQKNQLMVYEATHLLEQLELIGSIPVICTLVRGHDMGSLRMLANQLISDQSVVTLLGQPGENSLFVFAASEDIMIDCNQMLIDSFTNIGSGNGGGSRSFAQGGGVHLDEASVQRALSWAKEAMTKLNKTE